MTGKGGFRTFAGTRSGDKVAPIPDLPAHRYDADDLRLPRKPDGSRLSAGTKVVRKTVLGPAAESGFLDLMRANVSLSCRKYREFYLK